MESDRSSEGWWRFLARGAKSDRDNVDQLIRTYAEVLYVTARSQSLAPGDQLDQLAGVLKTQLNKPVSKLDDILALEAQLNRILPPELQSRRAWEYRLRFDRLASEREHAAYAAVAPPPDADAAVRAADNAALLDFIHKAYLMTLLREQAVRDLKRWIQNGLLNNLMLFGVVILLLAAAGSQGWVPLGVQYFVAGLALIFFVGRIGAAMSVIQRLQRAVRGEGGDAVVEVTALCTGRRGFSIAMMSGGVFAVLLYVMFGAGLGQTLGLTGGLFPEVEERSPADNRPGEAPSSNEEVRQDETQQNADTTPPPEDTTQSRAARGLPSSRADSVRLAVATTESSSLPLACLNAQRSCMPNFVTELGAHLGFQEYPDFFKMLLLAFLAGFAERLVPDALDRLIRRRSEETEEGSSTTAG